MNYKISFNTLLIVLITLITTTLSACSISSSENQTADLTTLKQNSSTQIQDVKSVNNKPQSVSKNKDNLKDEILSSNSESLIKNSETKETFAKDSPVLSSILQATFAVTGQVLAGGTANMGTSPVGIEY